MASESEHPVIGFFHHMRSLRKRRRELDLPPELLERLRRRAAWARHFDALAERDDYERSAEGG